MKEKKGIYTLCTILQSRGSSSNLEAALETGAVYCPIALWDRLGRRISTQFLLKLRISQKGK